MLVQHGSADEAVSLGQFAALVAELESAGVKHEATSYSGAPTRSAFLARTTTAPMPMPSPGSVSPVS
ncbi:hypothetical protein ACSZNR_17335 [Aeromonas caviae]